MLGRPLCYIEGMADMNDVRTAKEVRREFTRKMIDINQADIRVMHGVAYLTGVVRAYKDGSGDLKGDIQTISNSLISKRVIKDLVIHAQLKG